MQSEEHKPLRSEDFLGLVTVRLISWREIAKPETYTFEVEHKGQRYEFGVIGKSVLESIVAHGYENRNGVWLRVPPWLLNKERMMWLNKPY